MTEATERNQQPGIAGHLHLSRRNMVAGGAASAFLAAVMAGTVWTGPAHAVDADVQATLNTLRLPFTGPVTSPFGPRIRNGVRETHTGTDFGKAGGTPIPSAGSGTVSAKGFGSQIGYYVAVRHSARVLTRYHMLQSPSSLAIGAFVSRGQTLGLVGKSGASATGNHLHFELHIDGQPVDPMQMLDPNSQTAPEQPIGDDPMIRIQSPGRGIAIIGPGYYRHLATEEEVVNSDPIVSKHVNGNDRQFDLWVSMSVGGVAAKTS